MKKQEDMKPNDEELNRKRKNTQDFQYPKKFQDLDDEDSLLTLALSFYPKKKTQQSLSQSPPPPPPPPPQQQQQQQQQPQPSSHNQSLSLSPPPPLPSPPPMHHPIIFPPYIPAEPPSVPNVGPSRPLRVRRNPTQGPRNGKSDIVPAPYPWATTKRAMVHSLHYLVSQQIVSITGDVQCKRCERQYEMEYDLKQKFLEVGTFIAENKSTMHDRAPSVWMNPVLPACKFCEHENCVKPMISEKKKGINWLFLLLGQMLGCCTLEQLKYFCKHTKNHRTGAKDRVLYLTYLGLCKQLDANGPFDR